MIASILLLTRADMKALRVTDEYSLHRVVFSLFDDVRSHVEKNASVSSGILYAEKGGDKYCKKILLLSDRNPNAPVYGELRSQPIAATFLSYECYGFEIIINPGKRDKTSGKVVPIRGRDEIKQWFINKAPESWGFVVEPERLQVEKIAVKQFHKGEHTVTQGRATLKGVLTVANQALFSQSFKAGVGRARAFGCGLLQLTPLISPFNI